jgi:hypothetical protein
MLMSRAKQRQLHSGEGLSLNSNDPGACQSVV